MKLNVMLIGLSFETKSESVWYVPEVELEDICFRRELCIDSHNVVCIYRCILRLKFFIVVIVI